MDLGKARRPKLFHATAPGPCPYLPDRVERKLVVELDDTEVGSLYTDLSRAGFRRSHGYAYRPACKQCSACVPVRIRVADYRDSRSLARVRRRNRDLACALRPAIGTAEHYALFRRYQTGRHADSNMAAMDFSDYRSMVEETPVSSFVMELRDADDRLVGACLADWLEDGLSAVYSFFDPDEARRSLGSVIILRLIETARAAELDMVYLGYWISGSGTMDYKRRFPAVERLNDARWTPLRPGREALPCS